MFNQSNIAWSQFIENKKKEIGEDGLIKFILNKNNKYITVSEINKIFKRYKINHKVRDIRLFQIALTHPSYEESFCNIENIKLIFMGIKVESGEELKPLTNNECENVIPLQKYLYERLEFLGDSIIKLVLTFYLFLRYEKEQEGNLTKYRSKIENSEILAKLTRTLNLSSYILVSQNHELIKTRDRNEDVQCDVFEAFIAALYLDICNISYEDIGTIPNIMKIHNNGNSYETCYEFIINILESEIDIPQIINNDNNHKDNLLKLYHSKGWNDPTYSLMDTIIDNNKMGKRYYKMGVRDNSKNIIGWGTGSSKKKGEQLAAKMALHTLNYIQSENEDIQIDKNSDIIYFRNI